MRAGGADAVCGAAGTAARRLLWQPGRRAPPARALCGRGGAAEGAPWALEAKPARKMLFLLLPMERAVAARWSGCLHSCSARSRCWVQHVAPPTMTSLRDSSAALLRTDALVAQLKAISACEGNLALSLRMACFEVRRWAIAPVSLACLHFMHALGQVGQPHTCRAVAFCQCEAAGNSLRSAVTAVSACPSQPDPTHAASQAAMLRRRCAASRGRP